MTLILKQFFAFFKLLNSDTGTNQLASGLALGLILGFAPAFSLQTVLVIFILLFFRVQIGAAFISAFFFKFVAYLIDPVSHSLGQIVLESEALRPLFVQMYNMPIIPFTRFNNTITMGSAVISIILAIPGFFIFKSLIIKYRETVVARFKETKFFKALQATAFYKWYVKYDELYG